MVAGFRMINGAEMLNNTSLVYIIIFGFSNSISYLYLCLQANLTFLIPDKTT